MRWPRGKEEGTGASCASRVPCHERVRPQECVRGVCAASVAGGCVYECVHMGVLECG